SVMPLSVNPPIAEPMADTIAVIAAIFGILNNNPLAPTANPLPNAPNFVAPNLPTNLDNPVPIFVLVNVEINFPNNPCFAGSFNNDNAPSPNAASFKPKS